MPPTTEGPLAGFLGAIEKRPERLLLVGLDGPSGAGKTTLAAEVADALGSASVIKGDEFYIGGASHEWDDRSVDEKISLVIDWHRQRSVLETLRRGEDARWHGYDWEAFDGRLVAEPTVTPAAPVVILEGAYSCRPELADLFDLTVLLSIDDDLRLGRLAARDGVLYRDDWLGRWLAAEQHYFTTIRPPSTFDLVLTA